MHTLIVRNAAPADVPEMVGLLKQLFSIEEDFTFNAPKHEKGLQMLIQNPQIAHVLVAELNGKVVGMLTAQLSISSAEGNWSAMLEDMVVDKEYRGKGIGKKLMTAMQQWAESIGVPRLQLLTDKTNTNALAYYNKLNWKQTKMICFKKYTSKYNG